MLSNLLDHRVSDLVYIEVVLVGEIVKHVAGPDCLWAGLFVAEDQVDPLVDLAAHEL